MKGDFSPFSAQNDAGAPARHPSAHWGEPIACPSPRCVSRSLAGRNPQRRGAGPSHTQKHAGQVSPPPLGVSRARMRPAWRRGHGERPSSSGKTLPAHASSRGQTRTTRGVSVAELAQRGGRLALLSEAVGTCGRIRVWELLEQPGKHPKSKSAGIRSPASTPLPSQAWRREMSGEPPSQSSRTPPSAMGRGRCLPRPVLLW